LSTLCGATPSSTPRLTMTSIMVATPETTKAAPGDVP
jgi:hypothetical protein